MRALFDLFLDLCLFRKGPQHVPSGAALLRLCLVGYVGSGLAVLLLNTSVAVAILQVLADVALLAGLLRLALLLRRHPARFEQTLSALTGTGTLMAVLAFPLMGWIVRQGAAGDVEFPSLLLLALMAWSVAIMAHVLRHALDLPLWASAAAALGYVALSWTVTGWIGA